MRRFTVAFGACLTAGALQAAVQIDGSLAEKLTRPCVYTNAAGKTFNYRWHEPAEMADWKRYPLVVLMHGAGERGDDNKKQLVWVANNLFTYMKHRTRCGKRGRPTRRRRRSSSSSPDRFRSASSGWTRPGPRSPTR